MDTKDKPGNLTTNECVVLELRDREQSNSFVTSWSWRTVSGVCFERRCINGGTTNRGTISIVDLGVGNL